MHKYKYKHNYKSSGAHQVEAPPTRDGAARAAASAEAWAHLEGDDWSVFYSHPASAQACRPPASRSARISISSHLDLPASRTTKPESSS